MTKNLFEFMCDEYIENYNKYIECDNAIRDCSLTSKYNGSYKLCKSEWIADCKYMRTYHQTQMHVIEGVLNYYFKYLNDEYSNTHPNTGVVPTLFNIRSLEILDLINEDGKIKVDELLSHASNGLVD